MRNNERESKLSNHAVQILMTNGFKHILELEQSSKVKQASHLNHKLGLFAKNVAFINKHKAPNI